MSQQQIMERQSGTLSYRSLVKIDDVQVDLKAAYGGTIDTGDQLGDLTNGKVWSDCRFVEAVTIDGVDYAAGDYAVTKDTLIVLSEIIGTLDADVHYAVNRIPEGLWGSATGIPYQLTVRYVKTVGGVIETRIVADHYFKVKAPLVGE